MGTRSKYFQSLSHRVCVPVDRMMMIGSHFTHNAGNEGEEWQARQLKNEAQTLSKDAID